MVVVALLTDAQKEYFKDSVVRTSDGTLIPVYHGTQEEFDEFQPGTFFTDDYWNADGYASGEIVIEAYLNIKNPLVIDCAGAKWDELTHELGTSTRAICAAVDPTQYDGVIFNNIADSWMDDVEGGVSTVYYVFEPNQIKSIDNLNPTLSDDFREAGNISEAPDSLDSLIAAAEGQKQVPGAGRSAREEKGL